ncbi:hypothetical protein QWA68_007305 [Fusarium oxysporum]|nr:hypothetical protein QWA68_007305 [Fusarium oxysporum]
MADPSTYTVGWICALTTELNAAESLFDEEYDVTLDAQAPGDNNIYSFGRMGKHDVVVASLPEYGIGLAASVATNMLRTFPNIRLGLMVGIGGGAPSPKHDIRLGDVVVSASFGAKGGVLHHERGKKVQRQEFQFTGSLNQPPQFLLTAVGVLEADYEGQGHGLNERIEEALSKRPRLRKQYARPLAVRDRLYESGHIHRESPKSAACKDNCGEDNLVTREARDDDDDDPMIHYGLIASSSSLNVRKRTISPLKCYTFSECSLVSAAKSGNEHHVQMLLDNVFDLSRVVDLRQESKVTTSIYVKKAFVAALQGCHQRVITTLLDAMVNHAHTGEYATLSAASEVQNQHILREFQSQ